MADAAHGFDFDFGGNTRSDLLGQAAQVVAGSRSPLDGAPTPLDKAGLAASRLLADLNREVAELGAFPEVVRIEERHFADHGLKLPPRFAELSKAHRFYWLRIPLTLKPKADLPFSKLQCALEFNPGAGPAHLRPVAQLVLPDRKFQQLLEAHTQVSLSIGENFEFEAEVAPDVGAAQATAQVDAKAAAAAGFTAGPFNYVLKRARVNHGGTGSEKVFWSLDGAEFFEEQEPVLVVVLRVPKELKQVSIAAALQVAHAFKPLATDIGSFLAVLSERVAEFFRKGAPASHTQAWDITPRL